MIVFVVVMLFTSLVPDFLSLGCGATKLKFKNHRNLWFQANSIKICALCYSVSHKSHKEYLGPTKLFGFIGTSVLFMQCSLVFTFFFLFKLFVQQETLLRKLEDNVESEMGNRQKIVERTERELKEVIILSIIHS